jgi:hypothetical protein
MDAWIAQTDDPAATPLREAITIGVEAPGAAIDYLYREPQAKRLLERWWAESLRPLLPPGTAPVLDEVFKYDIVTLPVYQVPDAAPGNGLAIVQIDGESYYLRPAVTLEYDVPAIISRLRSGDHPDLKPVRVSLDLYYRPGVETFTTTTNGEEIVYFMGRAKADLLGENCRAAVLSVAEA